MDAQPMWIDSKGMMRWLGPAVLAAGFVLAALAPAAVKAQDAASTRVLVDVTDVVMRGGQPYYRYGHDGNDDRVFVYRGRDGRPVYYRVVRQYRPVYYPYGYGNGIDPRTSTARRVTCNSVGNCTVTYYDPQYDRRGDGGHHRGKHRDRGDDRWGDR
jgi:hypothetical protein